MHHVCLQASCCCQLCCNALPGLRVTLAPVADPDAANLLQQHKRRQDDQKRSLHVQSQPTPYDGQCVRLAPAALHTHHHSKPGVCMVHPTAELEHKSVCHICSVTSRLTVPQSHLRAAFVSQHVHNAVDEALLAGWVPAAEALTRLLSKQNSSSNTSSSSEPRFATLSSSTVSNARTEQPNDGMG